MFQEFKKFIMRGNVLDLAIAVIIGAAFGAIVTSFVSDIFTPILGVLTGGLDFSNYYLNLSGTAYDTYAAAKEAGAPVLGYGAFITTIINFLVVALALFFVVRVANRLERQKKEAPAPAPELSREEQLLTEIRDLLRGQARR